MWGKRRKAESRDRGRSGGVIRSKQKGAEMSEGWINTERRQKKEVETRQRLGCEGKPSAVFFSPLLLSIV